MSELTDPARDRIDTLLGSLSDGKTIPRDEGDLVFENSWQVRAFAMAVALHDQKQFEWSSFRDGLIESIRAWEDTEAGGEWGYYEHWLQALQQLLAVTHIVDADVLEERTRTVLTTPRDAEHQRAKREPVAVSAGDGHA